MALDWDILLDGVSIKDQVSRFEVRDAAGGYARELTLDAADASFYDQFSYTVLPQLRLEVRVMAGDAWVCLGKFYIEQPGISADPDSITPEGLWGRSETARAGAPFAPRVSKAWESDTTAGAIINEMAALVDLTVDLQMQDYTVFAGSYAVDGGYPIDVIKALAEYAGGTVGCTADGALVVRSNIFHPAAADYTVTDMQIMGIVEHVVYPEFGNRIRISADGSDSGLVVSLAAPGDADCLPADGRSKSRLYAFVSRSDGPVEDGVVVTWTADDGVSLAAQTSSTGQMLMANKIHNADNYYKVTVDYPVKDVVGIWAYADRRHSHNFWDETRSGCTFTDNEITVHTPFDYCDQTLVVTYITSGCAVNTVTAGTRALDVTVTADVNGAQATVDIRLGNTCACGSSLGVIKSTDTGICFGHSAFVLIWGQINGGPATGMIATLTLTGCGKLSSTRKILGRVRVVNERGFVVNEIAGVSQVESVIFPDDLVTPEVYLVTDTDKQNNLYTSHEGKVIDLGVQVDTGTEVWIDYAADGAAAVSWLSEDVDKECDAQILVRLADGTEAGLSETVSLSAVDCSDDESSPDATSSDYNSEDDPDDFDNSGHDGGTFDERLESGESGAGALDPCDTIILNRNTNIDNATAETRDNIRFGVSSAADCEADDPYGCPCSELCESEIRTRGNTYDYNKTIHETVIETYAEGTPEYNEAYAVFRAQILAECEQECEDAREADCADCGVIGPDVLSPRESAEYVCSDGTTATITMPDGACGTQSFTVGCCTFEVRSTDGQWGSRVSGDMCGLYGGTCVYWAKSVSCDYEIISGGTKREGHIQKMCYPNTTGYGCDYYDNCAYNQASECDGGACPDGYVKKYSIKAVEYIWTWECSQ